MENILNKRLLKIQRNIKDYQALLINKYEDIFYLTGFTGDPGYLLVLNTNLYLLTDGRFTEQATKECKIKLEIIEIDTNNNLYKNLYYIFNKYKLKELLINKNEFSIQFLEKIKEEFNNYEIQIIHNDDLSKIRMIKDYLEIEIIRNNLLITELCYNYVIRLVEENKSEIELASEIEYFCRKQETKKMAFDTIVASGERTSLPHATASEKKIKDNELIMFDFGIYKNGYCSDFTRCYYYGKIIDNKISEIHKIVLEALKEAENIIKPGIIAEDIHKKAYSIIEKYGYSKNFKHSTGHGVGLEIHELPKIGLGDNTIIQENMIFTIEPAIYIDNNFGIRLEDLILVNKNGCEILTKSGYEL